MKRYGAPAIVVDRFNRSNGNLGNAESGQAWLTLGSHTTAWVVNANVAKRATVTTSINDVAYIDCGRTNVVVEAEITITNNSDGTKILARMSGSDTNNCIAAIITKAGSIGITKTISGSGAVIASSTYSFVSGSTYLVRLECSGNDFKLYLNGDLSCSGTDDNALKTNTRVGMFLPIVSSAAFDYFDNFTVKG